MNIVELLPLSDNKKVSNALRTLYQQKVELLLFAVIATHSDIVFAVSRLSRFNQKPGKRHYKAANHVFHYLFQTQDHCVRYEGKANNFTSFIYVSDTLFSNNAINQKSS